MDNSKEEQEERLKRKALDSVVEKLKNNVEEVYNKKKYYFWREN